MWIFFLCILIVGKTELSMNDCPWHRSWQGIGNGNYTIREKIMDLKQFEKTRGNFNSIKSYSVLRTVLPDGTCCMGIEFLIFNHHSSRVNSKQNKSTPQTDIERLHDPGRIKNLKKKIKCLVYKTSPHVSAIAD